MTLPRGRAQLHQGAQCQRARAPGRGRRSSSGDGAVLIPVRHACMHVPHTLRSRSVAAMDGAASVFVLYFVFPLGGLTCVQAPRATVGVASYRGGGAQRGLPRHCCEPAMRPGGVSPGLATSVTRWVFVSQLPARACSQ